MFYTVTHRPRNVDAMRAASILYGDLGTSKAYVIGLAFALMGYASFWLIAMVSILTILIGINYIIICKHYPNGGGVYASIRHRSQIISMIGAFFLIADYLVTAALSALAAFNYFGTANPILFSIIFIGLIGAFNYYGPKHTGTFAFIIGLCSVIILTILALFAIPSIPIAWKNIQPLQGSSWTIWQNFVSIIIALSGIEAIANATGVMKLNPGATKEKPNVTKTSTPAIISVIFEVALYTTFFSFIAAAIHNFEFINGAVNAPGNPNVQDYMLKYLGEYFIGSMLGPQIGHWFATVLSIVIGILLLSAVNTAINGLIALQYVMAGDGEMPMFFQKLNRFGVPIIPLVIATFIPIILVITVKNVTGLAALYAIGFVGAIATNLGSTSTDKSLDLRKWERSLMFFSFLVMAAIEITLFIDKPQARIYALIVIFIGLLLRAISQKIKEKPVPILSPVQVPPVTPHLTQPFSILCPLKKRGNALEAALKKSSQQNCLLFLFFIREQKVITEKDHFKSWKEDEEAVSILNYAKSKGNEELIHFYYTVSDSPIEMISAYAKHLEVNQIFLDAPSQESFYQILEEDWAKKVRSRVSNTITISIIS
jgi:amino acid transporter